MKHMQTCASILRSVKWNIGRIFKVPFETRNALCEASHNIFRVTKTNLDMRPIYLSRQDRIIGHFITCFIALLILKQLQQALPQNHSIDTMCDTLRNIKLLYHDAYGYESGIQSLRPHRWTASQRQHSDWHRNHPKTAMRKILKQIKES